MSPPVRLAKYESLSRPIVVRTLSNKNGLSTVMLENSDSPGVRSSMSTLGRYRTFSTFLVPGSGSPPRSSGRTFKVSPRLTAASTTSRTSAHVESFPNWASTTRETVSGASVNWAFSRSSSWTGSDRGRYLTTSNPLDVSIPRADLPTTRGLPAFTADSTTCETSCSLPSANLKTACSAVAGHSAAAAMPKVSPDAASTVIRSSCKKVAPALCAWRKPFRTADLSVSGFVPVPEDVRLSPDAARNPLPADLKPENARPKSMAG
mmetsp:Transcript_38299/g.85952  ORF Transcript_38299/g.85952 Transcript_38299/m.85952 type:complete len:263 (+) Transcript_38299:1129-1917(+)